MNSDRKRGPTPHVQHDALVDALRRGAKVKWDTYEPFGTLRLPGSGEQVVAHPWEIECAYREIVGAC